MALNFVTFNQDYSSLCVGTTTGVKVFNTDPFSKTHDLPEGNVSIVEMLQTTSLVAMILSPRLLRVINSKRQSVICNLTFESAVLALRVNRLRLAVILEDQIYLYDISNLRLLYTIQTSPNPNAVCALSPSPENSYLVYPVPKKIPPANMVNLAHAPPPNVHVSQTAGEVLIFNAAKLEAENILDAHKSPISALALNNSGTLLATASDKGTVIRIFSVPAAQKLYQLRRGSMPARIYSMSFNITSTLLCVSSATETIHIFKLDQQNFIDPGEFSVNSRNSSESSFEVMSAPSEMSSRKHNGTWMGMLRRTSQNVGSAVVSTVGGYLPKGVTEMWQPQRDFAWIKLPKTNSERLGQESIRSVVAMSPNAPQVMVVTNEGNFYVFNIDLSNGGEGTLVKQYSVLDSDERLNRASDTP